MHSSFWTGPAPEVCDLWTSSQIWEILLAVWIWNEYSVHSQKSGAARFHYYWCWPKGMWPLRRERGKKQKGVTHNLNVIVIIMFITIIVQLASRDLRWSNDCTTCSSKYSPNQSYFQPTVAFHLHIPDSSPAAFVSESSIFSWQLVLSLSNNYWWVVLFPLTSL